MFLVIFNMYFVCSSYELFRWEYNNWYNIFTFRAIFSYYETRKKSILVNIELYNVDEQIKNHFY